MEPSQHFRYVRFLTINMISFKYPQKAVNNFKADLPLVSIITPSWNQGRYLRDCVRSVMVQCVGAVEHIVVDNCSDDVTVDVLKEFTHLNVLVEPDRGQCDAFNKGVAMARGEWILWLNADDFLLPGVMDAYLNAIRIHKRLNVIYGHMVFVDEMGKKIRTLYQPRWNYRMSWFGVYGLPSTGTMYRAELFRKASLDINFHMIMDSEWNLRNGNSLRVCRMRRETVAFRVTDHNKTSENIRTGRITPHHAAEREMLKQRYPYCIAARERLSLSGISTYPHLIRLILRGQVMIDKGCSRLISLFQTRKSI